MKQSHFSSGRIVRDLALSAGVLTVAFVAVPPAARAAEFRAPHEVIHRFHEQLRDRALRVVDHGTRFNDNHRRDFRRRPRQSYYPRYYRPQYRSYRPYPVIVGRGGGYGYDGSCSSRGYVSGYVRVPPVGIVVDVRRGHTSRNDDCDRDDRCGRERYRDDDRNRQDDDYDNDYDRDDGY